jgi:hypothetical protein
MRMSDFGKLYISLDLGDSRSRNKFSGTKLLGTAGVLEEAVLYPIRIT